MKDSKREILSWPAIQSFLNLLQPTIILDAAHEYKCSYLEKFLYFQFQGKISYFKRKFF